MKLHIIHPQQNQQPVAAALAKAISESLPYDVTLADASSAGPVEGDLVLAVFSLNSGAFAPIVPCYRDLRDKKVAFVAALSGDVDMARLRKTSWGIKKQFCGNEVVGGYFCPSPDNTAWGISEAEVEKARNFARKFYNDNADMPQAANF